MCCFCTLVMSSWGNLAENTGAVLQLSANNEAGAFFCRFCAQYFRNTFGSFKNLKQLKGAVAIFRSCAIVHYHFKKNKFQRFTDGFRTEFILNYKSLQ